MAHDLIQTSRVRWGFNHNPRTQRRHIINLLYKNNLLFYVGLVDDERQQGIDIKAIFPSPIFTDAIAKLLFSNQKMFWNWNIKYNKNVLFYEKKKQILNLQANGSVFNHRLPVYVLKFYHPQKFFKSALGKERFKKLDSRPRSGPSFTYWTSV